MASTYLQRTESAGNRKTFTWSAWIKRSNISSSQMLAACSYSSSDETYFFFNGSGKLVWQSSSASYGDVQTNRLFRDTNAWYHIVLAFDTTQTTASNRIRFYVNGVEETSFSNASYPNQDTQVYWNVGGTYYPRIGRRHAASDYFDGYMSHVAHIDGTQELPTIFGETDATTGEWKIKTTITPSSGWGTNGYHILKDNNSVTDQSGQGNNWTVSGGTLTKTEDNPSNVFATINPLVGSNLLGSTVTFANGNTRVEDPSGSASGVNPFFSSTLGMPSKGKFYCELKPNSFSTNSGHGIGIFRTSSGNTADNLSSSNYIRYIYNDTSLYITKYGSTDQSGLTAISSGDIVGMALDLDNGTLQYYVNGVARGSQITGVNSANDGYDYFFFANLESSSSGRYGRYYWNFGNGYFATTAVTTNSGNGYAGAEGSSIFNYQPPTGYSALSTKGLNT